jgi:hypothetical protein
MQMEMLRVTAGPGCLVLQQEEFRSLRGRLYHMTTSLHKEVYLVNR